MKCVMMILVGVISLFGMHSPGQGSEGTPWGISVHHAPAQYMDSTKAAGIDWIRVDFRWYVFQGDEDTAIWYWDRYDSLAWRAQERGLNVLGLFS